MNYKLCIPVSGGLDSFTAVNLAKVEYRDDLGVNSEIALLFIEFLQSPYYKKEKEIVDKLYSKFSHFYSIKIDGYDSLACTDDHVVLGRNAVISSIAVSLSPVVWMSATKFEDNVEMYDKNRKFWAIITNALEQACGYKKRNEKVRVFSPFQNKKNGMEKSEMILFLENLGIIEWRNTTSCFHSNRLRCGECIVCGKRFIYEKYAELVYGVVYDRSKDLIQTYDINPLYNKYLLETWEKMKLAFLEENFRRYDKERILIYFEVLNHYGLVNALC